MHSLDCSILTQKDLIRPQGVWADLAKERERHLKTGKRAERTKTRLPVPNLPLCHWSSQLFDLREPSSTDVPVLLLNQPIRELKIPRRGPPRKRHLKSEFAFFQSLSRLLHLVYFVKYKRTPFEPNS